MNSKPAKGWFKHADFMILDILMMQAAFVCAYWIISNKTNPYALTSFRFLAVVLVASQIATALFTRNYSGILRRGYYKELVSVLRYAVTVTLIAVLFLFAVHLSASVSRLQFGATLAIFVALDYITRALNKKRILKPSDIQKKDKNLKSLVVITSGRMVDEAYENLNDPEMPRRFFISGFMLMDADRDSIKGNYDVPIIDYDEEGVRRLREKWVDEVLIVQPSYIMIDRNLFMILTEMGIPFSFTLAMINDEWPPTHQSQLGKYKVITSAMRAMSIRDAFMKRTMDIIGAVIGSILTCILIMFVAPLIYIASPGPIFFKQKRVGLNGRIFEMYKFRSMHLDAEERKAELMKQNKIKSGLMFKMDDDPRIIKGIGHFIRNTSIELYAIIGLNQANPVFARGSSVLSALAYRHIRAPKGAICPI